MQPPSSPRRYRLAALWFADLVDFTPLASRDEAAAMRLIELFQSAAGEVVEPGGGRVVKFIGDAALAQFDSTEDAVRAALALRREFRDRCAAAGVEGELRIGIHVGDVVTTPDGDIYGDGVNVTARLRAEAEPGQVVVSEDVWRQLRSRPDCRFQELGRRRIKGITEPVRIFAVALRGSEDAAPSPPNRPPPPARPPVWHRSTRLGIAALAAAVVVALVYAFLERRAGGLGGGSLAANRVVIAPFSVHSADPELQHWSEGLVDVLARNLDAAGPLRTVSPSTAIRHWEGPADRATATTLGQRTDAELAVYGDLLPVGGDSVRVSAAVLNVASGRVMDEVTVQGAAERMGALTDRLTFELLQAVARTRPLGAVRTTSLASLTTLPALKAFLRGEQFFRQTAWDSARTYYERALAVDSTFPLALRRYGAVLGWQGTVDDPIVWEYGLRAGSHNRGLSPRDSLLVTGDSLNAAANAARSDEAFRGPEYWRLVRRLIATVSHAAERYPADPEVWYETGEALYHFAVGPAAVPRTSVLEAFDRAIALDSAFAPAYLHPLELAFRAGGRELGLQYARAYLRLNPTDITAEGARLAERLATLPPAARTQVNLDTISFDAVYVARNALDRWGDPTETAVHLSRELARRNAGVERLPDDCRRESHALAVRLAYRGRLRAARCALGPGGGRLLAELALLGGLPRATADSVLGGSLEGWSPSAIHALPYWAARGDTARIRLLMQRADSVGRSATYLAERQRAAYDTAAARAYLALARQDTAEALRRLLALPDTLCGTCPPLLRWTAVQLLAATHRWEEMERIAAEWRGAAVWPTDLLFALHHARALERRGELLAARREYDYVLDVWARADPVLQPYLAEARAGLRRLGRPPPAQ